jgi:CO dehydrogenase maturation factor
MVKSLLKNPDKKVLAIDADPAVGLATALGMSAVKTVDDIRNELIQQLEQSRVGDREEVVSRLDFEMFKALEEHQNLAFLAIGRPEKEGCYCQVNRILKDIIVSMAGHFDYVLIDGEAGIEQVNRRVMEKVSHLVLVADASAKALQVAETIQKVARKAVEYQTSGLIVNRVRDEEEKSRITIPPNFNLLGWVPEDSAIRACDIQGGSILELSDGVALNAVEQCLRALDLPGPVA